MLLERGSPDSEVIVVVVVVVVVVRDDFWPNGRTRTPFSGAGLNPMAGTHVRPRNKGRPKPSDAWIPTRLPTVRVHGYPRTHRMARKANPTSQHDTYVSYMAKREGQENIPTRLKPRQHAHAYTHAYGAD